MTFRFGPIAALWRGFAPEIQTNCRRLAAVYLLELVSVTALVTAPWPLKVIIDEVLGSPAPEWAARMATGREGAVLLLTTAFLLLVGVAAWAAARARILAARARERITVGLRERVVEHLQTLQPTIRSERRNGDLALRLAGDSDRFVRLFSRTLPLLLRYLATAAVTIIAMIWLAPSLGLLGFLALPGFVLVARHCGPRFTVASRRSRRGEEEVAAFSREVVHELPAIQALSGETTVRRRFGELNARTLAAAAEESRVGAVLERSLGLARGLAVALVMAGGALLVLRGRLTLGELAVLFAYTCLLLRPAERITSLTETAFRGYAAGERLLELLALRPLVEDVPGARDLVRARGRIVARDLWFSYPDPESRRIPVLRGVDLTLEPGRFTVLIGRTGSGKSTLLSLLLRLFDPAAGSLTVDGQPYSQVALRSLRSQMTIVSQDMHLFSGTLRDVLTSGEPGFDDDLVWTALTRVAMDEFVLGLPGGLDTEMAEDQLGLTVGQRQRLKLARAFLLDRPVLLLDEPLANVDAISAGIILTALAGLKAGRACLAITQHPELLEQADVVCRLENGRITTRELTARGFARVAG